MKRLLIILLAAFLMISCSQTKKDLHGAGATFPEPLYKKMFSEYQAQTGQIIRYEGVGSGGGIFRLKQKEIDFGATDILSEENNQFFYIPTTVGAVAIVYNLPANPTLNLTQELLVGIFIGTITHWNDRRIRQINPDITLPNQRILIVNRADESGTSKIFDDYLCKVNEKWKNREENPLKKFFSFSAHNNEEMASMVDDMSGSIGFLCLSYAIDHKMSYAQIENSSGNFVLPSMVSVRAAAETELPEDTKAYITNTDAEYGYPISSFTWIIVHKDLKYLGKAKAEKIKSMLNWMITEGQAYAPALNYASLPPETMEKAKKIIGKI